MTLNWNIRLKLQEARNLIDQVLNPDVAPTPEPVPPRTIVPPLRPEPEPEPEPEEPRRNRLEAPTIKVPTDFDYVLRPNEPLNKINQWLMKDRPVVVKIEGKHEDTLRLGYKYGIRTPDGSPLKLVLAGEMGSEIRGMILYGKTERIELHNLVVGTPRGSRSPIQDLDFTNQIVLHRLAFKPDIDHPLGYGGAGMKWGIDLGDGSDYLHIQDCYRINAARFEEHWAYLKGMGETYIIGNNIAGGNRTGFQMRSPSPTHLRPHGNILIEGNFARDYGWDWDFHNGGSCITVWENPDYTTVIRDNKITNAKYGCLAVTQQADTYLNEEGYAHERVVLEGNEFSNPKSDRNCASISAAAKVVFRGVNSAIGADHKEDWVINSAGSLSQGAKRVGEVIIRQKPAGKIVEWDGQQYVPLGT